MTSERSAFAQSRQNLLPPNSVVPVRTRKQSLRRIFTPTIFHLIVFLTAFLLIFSRRPDAITNAQFFAEDGQRWFADAYHLGIAMPAHSRPGWRISPYRSPPGRLIVLIFPFSRAPLVMNLCAILVQILPVTIFVSSRFSAIPLWKRLIASFDLFGSSELIWNKRECHKSAMAFGTISMSWFCWRSRRGI